MAENRTSDPVKAIEKQFNCETETAKIIHERARARKLVRLLISERVRQNLTQKEIAVRMNVSESKISRMENSDDANLNFGDIIAYLKALKVSVSILLDDASMPIATRVKHLVHKIADMLRHLTDLANGEDEDDRMKRAIQQFQGEVLFNFLLKYAESGAAIPKVQIGEDDEDELAEEPMTMSVGA